MSLPNIAFIGKAGSGKDTAAELLIEHLGYRRLAFADKLREVAVALWGEDARNDRDKLQALGTAVRDIQPDTWVNLALGRLLALPQNGDIPRLVEIHIDKFRKQSESWHPAAVTDCRFHNEAWALKGAGFILVRILADRDLRLDRLTATGKIGTPGWEDHISETDLDDWVEDYRVHNTGSKAEFLDELTRVITHDTRSW